MLKLSPKQSIEIITTSTLHYKQCNQWKQFFNQVLPLSTIKFQTELTKKICKNKFYIHIFPKKNPKKTKKTIIVSTNTKTKNKYVLLASEPSQEAAFKTIKKWFYTHEPILPTSNQTVLLTHQPRKWKNNVTTTGNINYLNVFKHRKRIILIDSNQLNPVKKWLYKQILKTCNLQAHGLELDHHFVQSEYDLLILKELIHSN